MAGVDATGRQQLAKQGAGVEADLEVLALETHAEHGVDGGGDDLGFGGDTGFADDVQIELVVLALAATRHAFVAEALGNRGPLEREGERALAGGDHAGERGGHLRAEGQPAIALILKGVDLVDDLFAGLARQ